MHALLNAVSANKILELVLPLLPERTYLVGGCIRDLLLGIEPSDFDLVTFGSPLELAHRIEERLGGKAFLMDRERCVARVAVRHGEYTIDISPARGADIETDLSERDITINAMACLPSEGELIDPLQGLPDLHDKRIRLIREKNLLDDPLRGLRCLRFAVQFGYTVDEHTMRMIRMHAHTIAGVASERIKHEFLKALEGPRGSEFFVLLDDAGYVREIFGDTFGNSTRGLLSGAVRHTDLVLDEAGQYLPGIGPHFSRELEHGMTRSSAFRLAAFLFPRHDAQPSGEHVPPSLPMERLALSAKSCRTISGTIAGACLVLDMAGKPRLTGRDMYRALSDHDGHIPEILLMALVQGEPLGVSSSIRKACRALWDFAQGQYRRQKARPLLSGKDVLDSTGIPPGALVGKLLRQVEEARAEGLIRSRREAFSYLRKQCRS